MALLLAGCAKPPPPAPVPLPVLPLTKPLPPMGAAENLVLPDVDTQGVYITPNRGMTGQQALWHVRMALNVAALGCRDAGDVMGVEYNRMLRLHAPTLARANAAADAVYAGKYGATAMATRDSLYTVVYNFFALPPAQKAFCPTARAVVTTINGLTPDALVAYAPEALALLEKPFQDFWTAYADYLRRLAEWRRLYRQPVVEVLPCPAADPTCSGDAPPVSPPAPAPPPALSTGTPALAPPRLPSDESIFR
ncbi:hypothetical protein LWE61_02800 [Sphingobium sufflavum]|uniref:hypothetical protein n=1 Tax=Sphingobium sufflavum TaxID=1129547 RepID=UPI001F483439|nr:hypothetical protein [Sphingobium sufflavum]MCE7795482.1 hypothetical protein [Sphingobium sufflavum]